MKEALRLSIARVVSPGQSQEDQERALGHPEEHQWRPDCYDGSEVGEEGQHPHHTVGDGPDAGLRGREKSRSSRGFQIPLARTGKRVFRRKCGGVQLGDCLGWVICGVPRGRWESERQGCPRSCRVNVISGSGMQACSYLPHPSIPRPVLPPPASLVASMPFHLLFLCPEFPSFLCTNPAHPPAGVPAHPGACSKDPGSEAAGV